MASALAAPAQTDEETAAMAKRLSAELAYAFVLPKDLKLAPELRAEAEKIGAAHLARIEALVPAWVQEERRLQAAGGNKANGTGVYFAVWARLLNELALWQIEPGDMAYEKATLEVLKTSPLACRSGGNTRSQDYTSRILRVQAMPAAQRQAALATERQLLEHWGQPRAAPQPWPNPLPQDAAMAAIARMAAGDPKPTPALPPILASELLAKRNTYQDLAWEGKCALQQWWARASLAQGDTPAAVLNAFRYGTLITATDRFGRAFETEAADASTGKPQDRPAYPKLAARFDVTGATRISRKLDASGKPEQASVIGRRIKVRGIRNTRPVAFENTFDALSVRYALQGSIPAKPGTDSRDQVFDMVWALEDSAPAGTSATPSKGKAP